MIVEYRDAKTVLRYCSKGIRKFFMRHGLDYLDFVKNGIEADELPQDDAMSLAVIAQAKKRVEQNG